MGATGGEFGDDEVEQLILEVEAKDEKEEQEEEEEVEVEEAVRGSGSLDVGTLVGLKCVKSVNMSPSSLSSPSSSCSSSSSSSLFISFSSTPPCCSLRFLVACKHGTQWRNRPHEGSDMSACTLSLSSACRRLICCVMRGVDVRHNTQRIDSSGEDWMTTKVASVIALPGPTTPNHACSLLSAPLQDTRVQDAQDMASLP